MKFNFLFSIIFFFSINSHSQELDQNLKMSANDIGQKITKKNKTKIAVADFLNNAGKSDVLTKYITEQFELGLINADGNAQVMDRKHIQQLLSDNHLQTQGLIDESTAKSSVGFIKVDGWLFGEITSVGEQIKISIKVIDISTSLIYAAYTSNLISDPLIKKIEESANELNDPSRNECLEKNTGDFCFNNNSSFTNDISVNPSLPEGYSMPVTIAILNQFSNQVGSVTINPQKSACFYNLPCGIYTYYMLFQHHAPSLPQIQYAGPLSAYHYTGQIKVERCKTTTLNVQ